MRIALNNMMEELDGILKNYKHHSMEKLHVKCVVNYAMILSEKENASIGITLPASVFHDIGRYLGNVQHTEVDYMFLSSILERLGYIKREIGPIYECIKRHSIHSMEKPSTIEQKVVFDADNLTLITPFGIARWFFMAEEWGNVANIEDAITNLWTICEKINKGRFFYTATAREIANKDTLYKAYVESLFSGIK